MAFTSLEITLLSAHGIKNVNNIFKMDVYANVSVSDGAMKKQQKLRTGVSAFGGTKPKWNHNSSLKFWVDYAALIQNRLTLKIELVSNRAFFHTKIGQAVISVNELLQNCGQDNQHVVTFPVSGQGTLSFRYKFGPQPQAQAQKPFIGYPVGSSSGYPQPGAAHRYPHPPQPGYGTHCSNRFPVTQQFNITGRHSQVTCRTDGATATRIVCLVGKLGGGLLLWVFCSNTW